MGTFFRWIMLGGDTVVGASTGVETRARIGIGAPIGRTRTARITYRHDTVGVNSHRIPAAPHKPERRRIPGPVSAAASGRC
jgi:hypothetical protein